MPQETATPGQKEGLTQVIWGAGPAGRVNPSEEPRLPISPPPATTAIRPSLQASWGFVAVTFVGDGGGAGLTASGPQVSTAPCIHPLPRMGPAAPRPHWRGGAHFLCLGLRTLAMMGFHSCLQSAAPPESVDLCISFVSKHCQRVSPQTLFLLSSLSQPAGGCHARRPVRLPLSCPFCPAGSESWLPRWSPAPSNKRCSVWPWSSSGFSHSLQEAEIQEHF